MAFPFHSEDCGTARSKMATIMEQEPTLAVCSKDHSIPLKFRQVMEYTSAKSYDWLGSPPGSPLFPSPSAPSPLALPSLQ